MSASRSLKFTCTKINTGSGKGGLKPDTDGYYNVIIGAFDIFNSVKEYYPMDGAKEVFKKGSRLMRRLANGDLKGEYGHPKRQVGQSVPEFMARLGAVHEDNVSHHFKSISVTPKRNGNGKAFYLVEAEVKPMGPMGEVLKASLENPHENIGFSIRAPVKDVFVGVTKHRIVTDVITWDSVNSPGLAPANKFDAVRNTNDESVAVESLTELSVPESLLYKGNKITDIGVALESSGLDVKSLLSVDIHTPRGGSSKW